MLLFKKILWYFIKILTGSKTVIKIIFPKVSFYFRSDVGHSHWRVQPSQANCSLCFESCWNISPLFALGIHALGRVAFHVDFKHSCVRNDDPDLGSNPRRGPFSFWRSRRSQDKKVSEKHESHALHVCQFGLQHRRNCDNDRYKKTFLCKLILRSIFLHEIKNWHSLPYLSNICKIN